MSITACDRNYMDIDERHEHVMGAIKDVIKSAEIEEDVYFHNDIGTEAQEDRAFWEWLHDAMVKDELKQKWLKGEIQ